MAVREPLVYNPVTGRPQQIPAGDTLDPAVIPSTPAPTQRTFAYWSG